MKKIMKKIMKKDYEKELWKKRGDGTDTKENR